MPWFIFYAVLAIVRDRNEANIPLYTFHAGTGYSTGRRRSHTGCTVVECCCIRRPLPFTCVYGRSNLIEPSAGRDSRSEVFGISFHIPVKTWHVPPARLQGRLSHNTRTSSLLQLVSDCTIDRAVVFLQVLWHKCKKQMKQATCSNEHGVCPMPL